MNKKILKNNFPKLLLDVHMKPFIYSDHINIETQSYVVENGASLLVSSNCITNRNVILQSSLFKRLILYGQTKSVF